VERCEDFPCCGHGWGECGDRPEFTADYWRRLRDELGDEEYERYVDAIDNMAA